MNKVYETEIISVGTELLLGHVTNTDSRDVSQMLSEIGINVRYHTVVGDNPQRLLSCVEIAKSRADIIITTGGLGPTCDDLTKQTLARAFGLELVRDEAEYQWQCGYARRSSHFTTNYFDQSLLPEGCTVFHNDWGTAPGCRFEAQGKIVIMLPGPPVECVPMFKKYAVPYLKTLSDEQIISHTVRIFGIGEGAVDSLFRDEMNAMQNPSMAPYAKECDCLLKVTAKAHSAEEGERMLAPLIDEIKERLGHYVYGVDVETLDEAAFALMRDKGVTFSAAESCTGGEIAKRITDLPGASAVFMGGAVTYTNDAKARILGIDPALIEEKGAVSYEVAKLMAENIRRITGSDIGVGVTGIAGPDSDGVNPVGRVFVSMAVEGQTWVKKLSLGEERTRSFIRRYSGNVAFDMIRRYISGIDVMET